MLDQKIIENPPFVKAKNYYPSRTKKVQLIVLHTMEAPEKGTTAESVAQYFKTSGVKASAHYCVDNNSIIQCVYDSDTAWACKNANSNGIHIEHAGYAKQNTEDWMDEYSKAMLEISAQECALMCKKFDIPVQKAVFKSDSDYTVVKPGICGHADVPLHGSHWDPGTEFPWEYYFELVRKFM